MSFLTIRDRAPVEALLVRLPPPRVIFAPRGRPPMLVWLHTADHIGLASPVQEAQGAPAPGHRARIMRFAMGEQEGSLALLFLYYR